MAEGKKSFIVYTSWKVWLDGLSNEQKGLWLEWMLNYTNDNNPAFPEDQAVKIACMMAQDTLKRDLRKYEDKKARIAEARRSNPNNQPELKNKKTENKLKSVSNQPEINTDISSVNVNVNDNVNVNVNDNVEDKSSFNKENKKEKTAKAFVKPTLEEVEKHIKENNLLVDAQTFLAFYESKGWMVGKNPMKSWKAALMTWHKKREGEQIKEDPQEKVYKYTKGMI